MSIEIRQLRCAVLTADTQSFSHSAQAMNIKQSDISKNLWLLAH
jgi:DNA-binding transcriptional LysR family regulator